MRRRLLAGLFLFALALVVALGLSMARNDRTTSMSEVQRDTSSLAVLVTAGLNNDKSGFNLSSLSLPVPTTRSSRWSQPGTFWRRRGKVRSRS